MAEATGRIQPPSRRARRAHGVDVFVDDSPWIEALTVTTSLKEKTNPAIVKGGGFYGALRT